MEVGASTTARHVEAYIRLEAATCVKMFGQGCKAMQWHDHLGEFCGSVSLRNLSELHMFIGYSALAPGSSGYAEGEAVLRLVRVTTNPYYRKPYFLCPICNKRTGQVLLAADHWGCRQCQGLSYRSQRLGPAQLQQRRLDELTRLLQPVGGVLSRPAYMRAARFAELSAEYTALRAALEAAADSGQRPARVFQSFGCQQRLIRPKARPPAARSPCFRSGGFRWRDRR